MLKKLLVFFIALAPLTAMPQGVKIATVNVQEIFGAMPELSGIETQLSNKQEEIRKKLELALNSPTSPVKKSQEWFEVINLHPPKKSSERIWECIEQIK